MQWNVSNNVTSHTFFSQWLTRSLFMLAEAASRRVYRDAIPSNRDTGYFTEASESSLQRTDSLEKIQGAIVDLQFSEAITQCNAAILDCFQKRLPSTNVVCGSSPLVKHDMIVYRKKKSLHLAAHSPSLPKRASPLSPRAQAASPYRHLGVSRIFSTFKSDNGYTESGLRLIKWHWEYRYDHWLNSLSASDVSSDERNSDIDSSSNPALFPRAGSLKRPLNDPESQALTDLDWALRHWSMNKVIRTLFLHDLSQRLASYPPKPNTCLPLAKPWERDWKLKWRIIQEAMLSGEENVQRYLEDITDGLCLFDDDIIMRGIVGEDRTDVDVCCVV